MRGNDPQWVEPLRTEQFEILDRIHHPFYADGARAEAEFFIVVNPKTNQTLGRVAAVANRHRIIGSNGKPKVGHFGFFESIDSQEVANGLLDAAAQWLREHGADIMLGPASPSQNYEYGLLVEGFERVHRFLLPHSLPFYQKLLMGYGMEKAKDLFVFSCPLKNDQLRQKMEQDARRFETIWQRRLQYIQVRPLNLRRLDEEVQILLSIMNRSLTHHWDYTPISAEEITLIARKLRPLLDPDLIQIVERKGVPAGLAMAIPDLNEIIRKLRTRLGWLQLVELFVRAKLSRFHCARLVLLGTVQDCPGFGLAPLALLRLYKNLIARGYSYLDAHWILEDNLPVLDIVRRYVLEPDRVYRVYSKLITEH